MRCVVQPESPPDDMFCGLLEQMSSGMEADNMERSYRAHLHTTRSVVGNQHSFPLTGDNEMLFSVSPL